MRWEPRKEKAGRGEKKGRREEQGKEETNRKMSQATFHKRGMKCVTCY